jgi:hypothetical protein
MEHDWRIGWIAAAMVIGAALFLAVDIAQNQNALTEPDTQTEQAAKQAGAFETPTDPNQYP